MTKKHEPKRPRPTRFACHIPYAKAVFLAGSFNDWSPVSTPMAKDADGNWSLAVDLKPGRYEYKFVVDGAWCCGPGHDCNHPGCQECVPNPFGTRNRVMEVA
jgi:1,4-alpha-glucan branching enzyme